MKDFEQPQYVGISNLLAASPLPVSIPPHIQSLVTLITMVESSAARLEMFNRNPSDEDDGCPAMTEYTGEWEAIDKRIVELTEKVNALAEEYTQEIEELAQDFEFSRLRTIAACQKDGCPDREAAQEQLGWQEGEEILQ